MQLSVAIVETEVGTSMTIEEAIAQRYPHDHAPVVELRKRLNHIFGEYVETGRLDADAEQRLCSEDTHVYWQQLSEVLLGNQLSLAGVTYEHPKKGPDFLVEIEGQRIWIEVITPTPANVPEEWLSSAESGVRAFPHQEILLRWTAAIKQKADVLLGSEAYGRGYLEKEIVKPEDC